MQCKKASRNGLWQFDFTHMKNIRLTNITGNLSLRLEICIKIGFCYIRETLNDHLFNQDLVVAAIESNQV